MFGYMYSETLGKLHFWLMFLGANIAFFPMHFLGLAGMPRRIADYPEAFAEWNFIASIGAYLSFAGLLVFFVGLAYAFIRKQRAAANPWGAGATTLEWTLPSPPPSIASRNYRNQVKPTLQPKETRGEHEYERSLHTRLCDILGCQYPVLQAGMGGVARSELVAAVAEAGGYGFLGMVREKPELIAEEIDAVRARTDGPFGVNLIPAATDQALLEAELSVCV